jgi:signal peptidase I
MNLLIYGSNKLFKLTWNVVKYYSFFYVATNYVIPIEIVMCEGKSMEPVLRQNDILLTEKYSVRKLRLEKLL